jgi:hypothetical protein
MPSFWEMYVFVWPQQSLADVVLAVVGAAYCVLGIWAGRSRQHWFVRAAAVLAALSLFALIEAYEALVLFALTIAILVAGELVGRRWRWTRANIDDETKTSSPASPRWQFQLHDLLLATVVAGGTDRQDDGGAFGDATAFNNAWFTPKPGLDFDLDGWVYK